MAKASEKLRILVSNDDGIAAPGLVVLEKIASALSDDVWVVAPEQEQSGAGHSLTLHTPVRARRISAKRHAVLGTPTDCVLLGLKEIVPAKTKINLLLSGVNCGSNVGDDVTYSGTIAAAMEGTILGVPSVALSLLYDDKEKVHWDTAEKYAPKLIRKLMEKPWGPDVLINLNFPNMPLSKVKGVKVCAQGKRIVNVQLSERIDPKGRPYFWLGGERDNTPSKKNVDIDYLHAGYITVTPISMDLTHYKTLAELERLSLKLA
jgi:5'-nucleotidase